MIKEDGHNFVTPDDIGELTKLCKKAEAEGAESFEYEGCAFLVAYTKYLLEYLTREGGVNGRAASSRK